MRNYGPLTVFVSLLIPIFAANECSRQTSRTVRNVYMQDLEPLYTQHGVPVPSSCPLSIYRDQYGIQEQFKSSESPSKWTCGFCGKSFYDERFLDKHFDMRHGDRLVKGEQVTCLGDYCDIFRCDIITGRITPHFWDIALCKEADMLQLNAKCQNLLQMCVPEISVNSSLTILLDALNQTLCSHLTCESFWKTVDDEVPRRQTVLYIIGGVFALFGLFIYYFIAYTHFFTDESLLDGSRRHVPRRSNPHRRTSDERVRRRLNSYQ